MNAPSPFRPPGAGLRRSHTVALVLLGGVGIVGGLAAWDAWQRTRPDTDNPAQPQPAPPPVSVDQTYSNNYHLPGAGYYHAPYHAWFPFPFNYHDPARGYYAGGIWQAAPWILAMMRSQPSVSAVTATNAALLARQQQEEAIYRNNRGSSGSSGYHGSSGGWFRGSSGSSPGSLGSSGSSVGRGGFGSTGHGAHGSGT